MEDMVKLIERIDELEKRIAALEAKQQEPQFKGKTLVFDLNTRSFEMID